MATPAPTPKPFRKHIRDGIAKIATKTFGWGP